MFGFIEGVYRNREGLAPLQQRINQAINVGLLRTRGLRERAYDPVSWGGAGVDRHIDGADGQISYRVICR